VNPPVWHELRRYLRERTAALGQEYASELARRVALAEIVRVQARMRHLLIRRRKAGRKAA
jgi:hypothetical protein